MERSVLHSRVAWPCSSSARSWPQTRRLAEAVGSLLRRRGYNRLETETDNDLTVLENIEPEVFSEHEILGKYFYAGTDLAIFDATSQKLSYVTGLPANVSSIGKTVFTKDSKVYIPVNVENEYPAIYRIDPATAQASKGVTIDGAIDITGFGFIEPKN